MRRRPALNKDWLLIALFGALASIRVLIYSAAFPFFNNVDEQAHFDLVMKYGQGHIPRSLDEMSPDAVAYIKRFSSPEYFGTPKDFPNGQVPPAPWTQSEPQTRIPLTLWGLNHEASSPPLYYLIAGIWSDLGSFLGFKGLWFLYWIRFLNVLLAPILVWLAYLAASALFPENRFILLGVPLLAAFVPQDTFYSIESDVLSPICYGFAFYHLVLFFRAEMPDPRRAIFAGCALAATILVKSSNLPLLLVVLVTLALKIRRLSQAAKLAPAALAIVEFALCALVPVVIWFLWNLSNYGDLTATAAKIRALGWTAKPLTGWFSHPIFSPRGAWIFWSGLMASFWRGEFVWMLVRLAMPAADVFYWLSSLVFVAVAMITLRKTSADFQRPGLWLAFWSFLSLVIFMALLSIGYDFGQCAYPSREHPYFISGRLVSAGLIPFLLLYVLGLERALFWIKNAWVQFSVLIAIVVFITISEILVNRPAFASSYNLFHL